MYEIIESNNGYDLLEINGITPDDVRTWVLGHYDSEPEAEREVKITALERGEVHRCIGGSKKQQYFITISR